jgi:hypothetical protein
MKGMVEELVVLVGGTEKGKSSERLAVTHIAETAAHPTHHALSAPSRTIGKEVAVHKAKEVSPDKVIPMDDDFKDF